MAVTTPGDIVLDVARAVDHAELKAARETLMKAAAGNPATGTFSLGEAVPANPGNRAPGREAFVKFEAMVLRQFVETMLPKQAESVYGGGLAGDMWKSLLADKLSASMAERGGIGIADRVLGDYYKRGEQAIPVAGVSQGPEHAALQRQTMLSDAMVNEIQRSIARTYGAGATAEDDSSI